MGTVWIRSKGSSKKEAGNAAFLFRGEEGTEREYRVVGEHHAEEREATKGVEEMGALNGWGAHAVKNGIPSITAKAVVVASNSVRRRPAS